MSAGNDREFIDHLQVTEKSPELKLREAIANEICNRCPMQIACLHNNTSLCDIDGASGKIMSLIKATGEWE